MRGDLCCPKCAAELTAFGMTGADIRNMQRQLVGMVELIAADKDYDAALLAFNNTTATLPSWPQFHARFEAARDRRSAAIANIGGAE